MEEIVSIHSIVHKKEKNKAKKPQSFAQTSSKLQKNKTCHSSNNLINEEQIINNINQNLNSFPHKKDLSQKKSIKSISLFNKYDFFDKNELKSHIQKDNLNLHFDKKLKGENEPNTPVMNLQKNKKPNYLMKSCFIKDKSLTPQEKSFQNNICPIYDFYNINSGFNTVKNENLVPKTSFTQFYNGFKKTNESQANDQYNPSPSPLTNLSDKNNNMNYYYNFSFMAKKQTGKDFFEPDKINEVFQDKSSSIDNDQDNGKDNTQDHGQDNGQNNDQDNENKIINFEKEENFGDLKNEIQNIEGKTPTNLEGAISPSYDYFFDESIFGADFLKSPINYKQMNVNININNNSQNNNIYYQFPNIINNYNNNSTNNIINNNAENKEKNNNLDNYNEKANQKNNQIKDKINNGINIQNNYQNNPLNNQMNLANSSNFNKGFIKQSNFRNSNNNNFPNQNKFQNLSSIYNQNSNQFFNNINNLNQIPKINQNMPNYLEQMSKQNNNMNMNDIRNKNLNNLNYNINFNNKNLNNNNINFSSIANAYMNQNMINQNIYNNNSQVKIPQNININGGYNPSFQYYIKNQNNNNFNNQNIYMQKNNLINPYINNQMNIYPYKNNMNNYNQINNNSMINNQMNNIPQNNNNSIPDSLLYSLTPIQLAKQCHIIAKYQNGCKFLQNFVTVNSELIKNLFFPEILKHLAEISNDQFANYLLKKIYHYLSEDMLLSLIQTFSSLVEQIGTNQYGTRVLQDLIDFLNTEKTFLAFINIIIPYVKMLVIDLNGSHIIYKLIETKNKNLKIIEDIISLNAKDIAITRKGSKFLKKYFDFKDEDDLLKTKNCILKNLLEVITDQYGNYLVQEILLKQNSPIVKDFIIEISKNIVLFSNNKFSSNAVEKCLENESCKNIILDKLLQKDIFEKIILNQFGNYVIQKALIKADNPRKNYMLQLLIPLIPNLKSQYYGQKLLYKLFMLYPNLNINI